MSNYRQLIKSWLHIFLMYYLSSSEKTKYWNCKVKTPYYLRRFVCCQVPKIILIWHLRNLLAGTAWLLVLYAILPLTLCVFIEFFHGLLTVGLTPWLYFWWPGLWSRDFVKFSPEGIRVSQKALTPTSNYLKIKFINVALKLQMFWVFHVGVFTFLISFCKHKLVPVMLMN